METTTIIKNSINIKWTIRHESTLTKGKILTLNDTFLIKNLLETIQPQAFIIESVKKKTKESIPHKRYNINGGPTVLPACLIPKVKTTQITKINIPGFTTNSPNNTLKTLL